MTQADAGAITPAPALDACARRGPKIVMSESSGRGAQQHPYLKGRFIDLSHRWPPVPQPGISTHSLSAGSGSVNTASSTDGVAQLIEPAFGSWHAGPLPPAFRTRPPETGSLYQLLGAG